MARKKAKSGKLSPYTLPQLAHFRPQYGEDVFVHPSATVIGRVHLKDHSSVWPGSVLRGDINEIVIGKYSNVQDLSVIHVENNMGCYVGDYCVIGHRVILHACKLGEGVLVGMGAIVLNGAKVGNGVLIGAGALVTENAVLKPESLYLGAPARWVRKLSKKEVKGIYEWAKKYDRLAEAYRKGQFHLPL